MIETLFRGKRTDTDEWVEGKGVDLNYDDSYILEKDNDDTTGSCWVNEIAVYTETVGQFTGLYDKNGKRIFEGDIVTGLFLFGLTVSAVVTFQDGAFGLEWYRGGAKTFDAFTSVCNVGYEVIGNIHDDPELLK